MSAIEREAAVVEAFLAAEKLVIGATEPMQWVEGRQPGECRVKLPLEVAGEQTGQSLMVIGFPRSKPADFRLLVNYPPCIARLDFEPGVRHANSFAGPTDDLEPVVKGPHFHPWTMNKRFFNGVRVGFDMKNAVGFTQARTFDAALRWFCAEHRIVLPGNHTIDLPPRDVLL